MLGVLIWKSIVEDFVEEGFGVGVVFVEGKNGTGEVPGEGVPWEGGYSSGERTSVIQPVVEAYCEEGLESVVGVTEIGGAGVRGWADCEQWG